MIDRYHPWGPIHWLIPKLGNQKWSILGVLGAEDRSAAILSALDPSSRINSYFVEIQDPTPPRPHAVAERIAAVTGKMQRLGLASGDIYKASLLQDVDTIEEHVNAFVSRAGPRIICDISVMPKRWFFPVVRFLLRHPGVDDLVISYSSAESYGSQLSSDPAQLAPLPTFDGDPLKDAFEEVIVAIGFAPLGLRDLYTADIGKIRYLFPFPPGPPNFNRNWKFLKDLETEIENRNLRVEDHWHVHMYDCPSTFAALCKFTDQGRRVTALAPFGPKTLSLAMCLFALALEEAHREPAHVLYTQPRRYALDYSTGIKEVNGRPDVKGYVVKQGGVDLYKI